MEEQMKNDEIKNKKSSNKGGKHKAKATPGDVVFRTVILVIIFFIVLLGYAFYIR